MQAVRCGILACLIAMVVYQATIPCCVLPPPFGSSQASCSCGLSANTACSQCGESSPFSCKHQETPSAPTPEPECPFCAGVVHVGNERLETRNALGQDGHDLDLVQWEPFVLEEGNGIRPSSNPILFHDYWSPRGSLIALQNLRL